MNAPSRATLSLAVALSLVFLAVPAPLAVPGARGAPPPNRQAPSSASFAGCQVVDVPANSTRGGVLQPGDCTVHQLLETVTDRLPDLSYVDQYRVTLPARGWLTIGMASTDVDAYLALMDQTWAFIDQDDDGGGTPDAALRLALPAGSYTILANSVQRQSGSYTLAVSFSSEAPPPACVARPLGPSDTLTGLLATASCRSFDFVPGQYDQSYGSLYELRLAQDGLLTVSLTSAEFDTVLRFYDRGLGPVKVSDDLGDDPNSLLELYLRAGTYFVLAQARGVLTGSYALNTSFAASAASCEPQPVSLGSLTDGRIADGDCRVPYFRSDYDQGAADLYRVTVPQYGTLDVKLAATDFDAYLEIYDDRYNLLAADDDDAGTDARVAGLIDPGRYIIAVETTSPAGGGEYQLEVIYRPQGRACTVGDIAPGAVLNGTLSATDCTVRDLFGVDDDSYADVYRLHLAQRGHVTVTLHSSEVDAYLVFLGFGGRILTREAGGADMGASLDLVLGPGDYTAVANSVDVQTGGYGLSTAFEPQAAAPCGIQAIAVGGDLAGRLERGSCHSIEAEALPQMQTYVDQYRLRLTTRGVLNIEATSSDFEPLVHLMAADTSEVIAELADGDVAGGAMTLPPGDYLVRVGTLFFNQVGAYHLSTSFAPQAVPGCTIPDVAPPAETQGDLDGGECLALDLLGHGFGQTYWDVFRITVPERGTLNVRLSSTAFDVLARLFNARFGPLAADDDSGGNTDAYLSQLVTPGTYYLTVESAIAAQTGAYSLHLDFQPQYRYHTAHLPFMATGR